MSDPTHIFAWRRLSNTLTTSGQPSKEGLASIRALGVEHIVNLGLHDHEKALPDEGATVAALGMSYTHIPVEFDAPTEEDFTRFSQVMDEGEARAAMETVWRPGGVWAAFIGDEEAIGRAHRPAAIMEKSKG